MEKQKPEAGKSALFSIIGVVAFYISYFVLGLLLALFFGLLVNIPIIKNIVAFLFHLRGDSPDILVVLASTAFSYSGVGWMLGRFCDKPETLYLSRRILGIILLVMNILFLIINISEGNSFFPNIVVGVAGLIMFFSGRE